MIETRDLVKSVDTSEGVLTILRGVSLKFESGEAVAIVGASGSGKSTLLGLMAGLDSSTSGEIILDGHELSSLDEEERAVLRGQLVGFVFQSFQLLPSLTALENVMLPIELKGDSAAKEKQLIYWVESGFPRGGITILISSLAESSNGLRLLERSQLRLEYCSQMNLQAISIPQLERRLWNFSLI